ncbi:hypothetical protein [Cupriavidus pauculus]|uniref:EamA family transporter n=1 Tax=Cupriavidus pauculus TaxID=82633 RepID=A0A2N5C434_9BURK|nr:hypothetical protein [Cupriavidus pauculus]PLP96984.1 hypothetical protein CYJ10_29520 [Cupriavidus pauculus]
MSRLPGHIYLFLMLALTIYSQLLMRWQVGQAGPLPGPVSAKVLYVVHLLLTPWVLSSVLATFLAGVCWMLTLTQLEISYAYPFVSLVYIFVMLGGVFIFGDMMNIYRVGGTAIVLFGIFVIAKGG